jgi:hypothetical protein
MSQPDGSPSSSPTATQPIINIIDPKNSGDISWEVNDGLPSENPLKEIEREEIPPEGEENEEKEQVEVEEKETEDESQEQEEDGVEKKKTLRAPKNKRISDLTRKIKQRDSMLQEVLARNQLLEKDREELKKQNALQEKQRLEDESKHIDNYIKTIREAHSDALAEGEYERATEAASLLAQYNARKETLAQQKYQMDVARTQQPPQQSPQEYQDSQWRQLSEEFQTNGKEWITQNQWADANSVNYDPEMLQEAEEYVENLMRRYKFEGRGEEIGTPEFFGEITQHVRDTFDLPITPSKLKSKLVMKGNQMANVAPVNRSNPMSPTSKSKQDIQLTHEQRAMAHSMSGKVFLKGVRVTDKPTLEAIYKANIG